MFGMVRKKKREVRDRTVYMEVFGENKVSYRVTAGRMLLEGSEVITYGIEVESTVTGQREEIADFSRDIEDAVDFAEMLISNKIPPAYIYTNALNYLRISI